jgi:hypothetical protein
MRLGYGSLHVRWRIPAGVFFVFGLDFLFQIRYLQRYQVKFILRNGAETF